MTQVKPIPDGMHTVTPHLVCAKASEAIEAIFDTKFDKRNFTRKLLMPRSKGNYTALTANYYTPPSRLAIP